MIPVISNYFDSYDPIIIAFDHTYICTKCGEIIIDRY